MCLLTASQWHIICGYCWCSGQWWCIQDVINYTLAAPSNLLNHLNVQHILCNRQAVWKKMRKKYANQHVMNRDGVYYYVRHIPYDLIAYYNVSRLCFSLKTKSLKAAIRASKSVSQRLEDYWLGLRLQNMDIPAIQVVKPSNSVIDDGLLLSEASLHLHKLVPQPCLFQHFLL